MRIAPVLSVAAWCLASPGVAGELADRFSLAGYLRIMARPDWEGGNGRLGYSNLYGRLMNEGPWGALELKIDALPWTPDTRDVWASIHVRVEGGSFQNADVQGGNLAAFRVSQLYVRAGNLLADRWVFRLGTLEHFYSGLGLYDFRLATLFYDTLGVSAQYQGKTVDVLLGLGDAGFGLKKAAYVPVLSGGAGLRLNLSRHVNFGLAAQAQLEPFVQGNQNASYVTPGLDFETYWRREVVKSWDEQHPGQLASFPRPETPTTLNQSFTALAFLGFGGFGPILWNDFILRYSRPHPANTAVERYQGTDYTLYIAPLQQQRSTLEIGDELHLRLIPGRLDAALSGIFGQRRDLANTLAPSENNLDYGSALLRLQLYLTPTVHWLAEGVFAREVSKNGNLYRNHVDSVFQSTRGLADNRGLEFGDADTRQTLQGKTGLVLNPTGIGLNVRPSLRLLYGVQHSTAQAAYGNAFVESLSQYNAYASSERHLHHLVSLEAEAWF